MIERLIAKERIAKHLTSLSDQELSDSINFYNRTRNFIRAAALVGIVPIAGSFGAVVYGKLNENELMVDGAFAVQLTMICAAYLGKLKRIDLSKKADMAASEAFIRGLQFPNERETSPSP